eukprot:scaffold15718_cov126-Cylindrotheca_fusiformis.AAC.4
MYSTIEYALRDYGFSEDALGTTELNSSLLSLLIYTRPTSLFTAKNNWRYPVIFSAAVAFHHA